MTEKEFELSMYFSDSDIPIENKFRKYVSLLCGGSEEYRVGIDFSEEFLLGEVISQLYPSWPCIFSEFKLILRDMNEVPTIHPSTFSPSSLERLSYIHLRKPLWDLILFKVVSVISSFNFDILKYSIDGEMLLKTLNNNIRAECSIRNCYPVIGDIKIFELNLLSRAARVPITVDVNSKVS